MARFEVGWTVGSAASCALARVVCGPTAAVRYIDINYGRNSLRGRTYYVHVADEHAPLERLHYSLAELDTLLHTEADPDLAAARRMLERRMAESDEPPPVDHSYWDEP